MTETDVIDVNTETSGTDTHWSEKYPSLKGNKTIQRYKTEEESHLSHLEAKKALMNPLRVPDSLGTVTDEQRAEWEGKIAKLRGVPDSADKYVLKRPEDMPAELFSDDRDKAIKEFAKKRNLTNPTLQEMYDLHNQIIRETYEKKQQGNEKAAEECAKILDEKWGNEAKENHILCKRYLRALVNPEWTNTPDENNDEKWQDFTTKIFDSQVGNNPVIMQAILQAAKSTMAEGKVLPGVTAKGEKQPTTDEEIWKKNYPNSPYPG